MNRYKKSSVLPYMKEFAEWRSHFLFALENANSPPKIAESYADSVMEIIKRRKPTRPPSV